MSFGQVWSHVSLGAKIGAPLTDTFDSPLQYSVGSPSQPSTYSYNARTKGYLVGPSVEVRLPLGLALEVDALYSRLNGETVTSFSSPVRPPQLYETGITANRWEFPLLAKYHLPITRLRPFVSAGPTFSLLAQETTRLTQTDLFSAQSSSRIESSRGVRYTGAGIVAGSGIEWSLEKLRFTPEVRYIHRQDAAFNLLIRNDQAQFLLGISFGR